MAALKVERLVAPKAEKLVVVTVDLMDQMMVEPMVGLKEQQLVVQLAVMLVDLKAD